jgi:polysaccharide pyruvyl transferase WcaK-like protein
VSTGARRARRPTSGTAPRVGVFGLLGAGNLGNEASLEVLLGLVRNRYPEAVLSGLCAGPEYVSQRYGIAATRLHWNTGEYRTAAGPTAILAKVAGKAVDVVRTLRWVRRQDVVLVPGMGVLEASLPLRPWGFPYSLFLLCAAGRLTGTPVALVSVGADVIRQRATRWVVTAAARLAHFRSYRDALSRDAMRTMGVDVSGDTIAPDLAFALPIPPAAPDGKTVGVGLMDYHGSNDDRDRADELHRCYVEAMKRVVRWLVDNGRPVRLFVGDEVDDGIVQEILADVRACWPGLDPSLVVAERTPTVHDLLRQLATVQTVIATRYHNVLCALRLSVPALSIGYSAKHDVLMEHMGLGDFRQSAVAVDVGRLIEQFTTLESRRDELVEMLRERNRENVRGVAEQFDVLAAAVFEPRPAG